MVERKEGEVDMNKTGIPFQVINWVSIPITEHVGEKGFAFW